MISRTQYPPMLTYACTIHKAQGLAIPITLLVFDLVKQKSYNYGQQSAALSHAKSLAALKVVEYFRKEFVKAH